MSKSFLKQNNFDWINEYGSFKLKGIDTHGGRKKEAKVKAIAFTAAMTFEVEEGEIVEEDRRELSLTFSSRRNENVKTCNHKNCSDPAARTISGKHDLVWCRTHLTEFRSKSTTMKMFEELLRRTASNIRESIPLMEKIIDIRKEITENFYKSNDAGHLCRINYLIQKKNLYNEALKAGSGRIVLFSEDDYTQYKNDSFVSTKAFVDKQKFSFDELLKSLTRSRIQ